MLERADCAKLGMGAYVGVAQGSHEPPKFIHLTYKPKGRARKRVVVIGKGITFDSGGLDLKPADGMYRMKDDMSGAAAVLGLFQALPKLALPVEVHGLIAATENMPSGTAQRPGDVVRAMNGLTIEIGNTDAEGRLTLADALAYAAKEIKPDEMVDLATLTGAIVIALGMGLSGVFATDDGLAGRVLGAAETAGEKMWRMPLHDEYKEGIKSDIADLNNISSQRGGGAIVAGLFMRDFTGGRPWAHLDIAGTAFTERELPLGPKGATGVGVRTLLAYLSRARRQAVDAGGVDLHTHTTASDGTYTPSELVAEAAQRGVRVLAVTDHDSTEGLAEAMEAAARRRPLEILPGIEINCDVEGAEIHVLGYLMDWQAPWFQEFCREQRRERRERVHRMVERLAALGMPIEADEVFAIVQEGSAGRPARGAGHGRARLRQDGARGLRQVPGLGQAGPRAEEEAHARGRRAADPESGRRAGLRAPGSRRPRRDDPGAHRRGHDGHRVLLHRALGGTARGVPPDLQGPRPGRDGRLGFPRPQGARRHPRLARRAHVRGRRAPRQSRSVPRRRRVLAFRGHSTPRRAGLSSGAAGRVRLRHPLARIAALRAASGHRGSHCAGRAPAAPDATRPSPRVRS